MPEARKAFPELETMEPLALSIRYNSLRDVPEDQRSDDDLLEMVSILGILRRKSAGPPKAPKASAAQPTLDDL